MRGCGARPHPSRAPQGSRGAAEGLARSRAARCLGAVFECIQRGAEDYLLKPVTAKEAKQLWQHVWRRRYSWRRVPGPARGTGADEVLRSAPAPEASAEVTGAEAAGEEEGSEMYTAAEMRDHCMRQIARYTRVIQIIDSHPHLFPGAAAGAAAAAAAADGQAA